MSENRIKEVEGIYIHMPKELKLVLDNNMVNYDDGRVLHFISQIIDLSKVMISECGDSENTVVAEYMKVIRLNSSILENDVSSSLTLITFGENILGSFCESLLMNNVENSNIHVETVLDDKIILTIEEN